MTVEKAIRKLELLSKLTSSKEPCEMAIAALKVTRWLGLSYVVKKISALRSQRAMKSGN